MIEAVVFDMDGVIFDSERLYRKHWKITAQQYGIPEEEMEPLCDLIAGGTREHNEKLMKDHFGQDFDYTTFRQETMDRMDRETERFGVELKPGVVELFHFLHDHNIKIGLATSTQESRAGKNLERAELLPYFDAIVYGGVVEHGKPAPDIYLEACRRLSVNPVRAMGIEDSINGVKASHAAGLYTIMVVDLVSPTPEIREIADEIFSSLLDVISLLQQA